MTTNTRPLIVGLTGGIASGKSTVAGRFQQYGVPVCDADQLSRQAVAAGSEGLQHVADYFGTQAILPSGEMNRPWLRQQIFADPSKRQQLENIIHPIVRQGLLSFVQHHAEQHAPYVILEVPLLIEGGLDQLCDRVLVVDVDEATQMVRLQARDDCGLAQAQQILAAQSPRAARLNKADNVIDNQHSVENLTAQIKRLHAEYLQLASNTAQ